MASDELHGDDLLTFGEAAEYAGISLLDLRERLRGASVPAVWGWRAGSAVHLVTLESLQTLFPGLCDRRRLPNLSLSERGIEILPETPPSPEPDLPGRRNNPLARDSAPAAHLDDLHGEIREAAAQNAKLIAELSEVESGLGRILGGPQAPEPIAPLGGRLDPARTDKPRAIDKIQQWRDLETQRLESDVERRKKTLATWSKISILAVVFIAVVSLKSKDYLLASSGPHDDVEMPAIDPERVAHSPAIDDRDMDPLAVSSPLWGDEESEPLLSAGSGLVSFEMATGSAPSESAEVSAEESSFEVQGLTPPAVASPASESVATLVSPVGPRVPASELVQEPTSEARSPVGPSYEFAALVTSQDAPCLFSKLTAPGNELRGVLGPCIGPWNEKAQAVSGGFRHSGERYCRHHLIVAKDLGGSVDRARNVARIARKEGLLPPLVRLRVEHGAADLLQTRVGKWVESGFEAGLSGQHLVTAQEGDDRWSIQSWVRLQAMPGGKAELKHFTMELQLAAKKGQDRWISFEWVQGDGSGE